MPNIIDDKSGKVIFGNDYYQMMMVWSLVAALDGGDISRPCQEDGLVDRILKAAK